MPVEVNNPAWPLIQINAPLAWSQLSAVVSCPSIQTVVVAVIDSGVASDYLTTNHPDLPACLFLPGGNTTGIFTTSNTIDDHGHGTSVCGIIAAQWNNGNLLNSCTTGFVPPGLFTGGMAGLAGYPGLVQILPVKVAPNSAGGVDADDFARGINYAVSQGAQVLNISISFQTSDPGIQAAIENALSQNCVVVAASGNGDTVTHVGLPTVNFPARYPGVISVGATDQDGFVASYSNYGSGLQVVAPGGGDYFVDFNTSKNIHAYAQSACAVMGFAKAQAVKAR